MRNDGDPRFLRQLGNLVDSIRAYLRSKEGVDMSAEFAKVLPIDLPRWELDPELQYVPPTTYLCCIICKLAS